MKDVKSTSELFEEASLLQSSVTNTSMTTKRISRKTDETSATRRSLSRRSSQQSNQKPQAKSFFVKMSTIQKIGEDHTPTTARNDILKRDNPRTDKKRSPTPLPGTLTRRRAKEKEIEKQNMEMQSQLIIAELQNQLNGEKEKAIIFQKKANLLEKEVKCKLSKIEELGRVVQQFSEKEKQLMARLYVLDGGSDLKDQGGTVIIKDIEVSSGSFGKSKLERLKDNIKMNRFAQLESDNARLRKENQELKNRISLLEEEKKEVEVQCNMLEKKLFIVRNRSGEKRRDDCTSTQDSFLKILQETNMKLEARVSKLEIQLNYMNRKKIEEMEQWKEQKNRELTRVRKRLTTVNKQLTQQRVQNERLRKGLRPSDGALYRSSLLLPTNLWPSRQDVLELSLSPQHFEY